MTEKAMSTHHDRRVYLVRRHLQDQCRRAVLLATLDGRMPRAGEMSCEVGHGCKGSTNRHHDSYAPEHHLDVRPLCARHHAEWHNNNEPHYPEVEFFDHPQIHESYLVSQIEMIYETPRDTVASRGSITEAELAKHLSVSRSLIRKLRSIGNAPPWFLDGRTVKYRGRDVEAWEIEQAHERR